MSGRRLSSGAVAGRIGGRSFVANRYVPVPRGLVQSSGMPLTNINDVGCGRQHPDMEGAGKLLGIYFAQSRTHLGVQHSTFEEPMARPSEAGHDLFQGGDREREVVRVKSGRDRTLIRQLEPAKARLRCCDVTA